MKSVVVCFAAAIAALAGVAEVSTEIASLEYAEGMPPVCEPGEPSNLFKVWINEEGEVEIDPESFRESGVDFAYLPTNGFPSRIEVWEDRKIMVSERDYYCLTQNFAKVWRMMNENSEYRRSVHGRLEQTIMTPTHKLMVYEDGFVFAEKIVKPKVRTRSTNAVSRVSRRINGSKRYRDFSAKRDDAKTSPVKEVTVSHDAVTGKDVVK